MLRTSKTMLNPLRNLLAKNKRFSLVNFEGFVPQFSARCHACTPSSHARVVVDVSRMCSSSCRLSNLFNSCPRILPSVAYPENDCTH